MATIKKRINISVPDAVEQAIATLAKRDQVPHATKAGELLELALEIEEDTYFASVVKERMLNDTLVVDHENAWT